MITCTSTHCERRQECASPNDCTGSAKRRETPCEHCGGENFRGVACESLRDGYIARCDGCDAYAETVEDEGARP